ncbi:MAG: HU family DNA-binding protein [Bdellovibrionota bacterium]|tara:strand:- start:7705 stop:8013 length:309 start_codon:yes stop_codon:yes gene_type:complete
MGYDNKVFAGDNMNKAQLIDQIAAQTGSTKTQTEKILDALLDTIQKQVQEGDGVKLVGFGSFTKSKRKERKGHNPQTGEEIHIPETWYPKFKPGSDFKSSLN